MSILNKNDVLNVINRYKNRIEQFGVSFDSMKSGSVEKKIIRHSIHASSIKNNNPEILDIGFKMGISTKVDVTADGVIRLEYELNRNTALDNTIKAIYKLNFKNDN